MKIAYVTATFPCGHGEGFLDAEIQNVARLVDEILLIPTRPIGKIREHWSSQADARVRLLSQPLFTSGMLSGFLVFIFLQPLSFFSILSILARHSRSVSIFAKNLLVFPKSVWLAKRLKSENVRHIHVHWASTSSTMVLICGVISKIPWSMTCHRWDIYEDNLLAIKSNRAKFVRFISRRGATDAEKIGAEKTKSVVIPMGVVIDASPPVRVLQRSIPQILCAANFIEVKGHKFLIEAIRLLKEVGIPVRLMLAGTGPLENELKGLSMQSGLEDRVEFMGQLAHDRLLSLYDSNQVDLFVLPSIEAPGGVHEGIPVSLMEAMARGVPCISTKTGSIEELIPASLELTVSHSNSQELADKIKQIIVEPGMYRNASIALGGIVFPHWTADRSASQIVYKMSDESFRVNIASH